MFDNRWRRGVKKAICTTLMALATPVCLAWTSKPVKIVVPAPAGGLQDTMARLLADQLAIDLGQSVIVENKPGGGGYIGIKAMMSAPGDGQTIMVTASNVLTEIPLVMKTDFNPLKDVRPVAAVALSRLVLVSSSELPAKDLAGLIDYARARPGKLSYASYSTGSASHYGGVLLNRKAGLDLQHVPFPGAPPALVQVVGGQIAVFFDNIPSSLPMIRAGKLRAYGVTSRVRSSLLPNVPTFAEMGYQEMDFTNWLGVVVSANVPSELVEQIRTATLRAAAVPRVRNRMLELGFEPVATQTVAQLGEATKTEYERNAAIVKALGIRPND